MKKNSKANSGDARTSDKVATAAAKVLKDPSSTKAEKSAAASALRQRRAK
jgi:hypothetical protein